MQLFFCTAFFLVTSSLLENLYKTDKQMQISRKNKLVFVHVPKTGGTTIERSSLFDDARKHHLVGGHHAIDEMMYNAADRQIDNFFKFSVIRHPCERFISAYNYLKFYGNKGNKQWALKNIHNLTIDSVADNILSGKLMYTHFKKQKSYLFTKDGKLNLNFIFCTSTFEFGLKTMASHLPHIPMHNFPLKKYNTLGYKKLVHKHSSCLDLSMSTRKKIEKIYAVDYCIFNFSYDSTLTQTNCLNIQNQPIHFFTVQNKRCSHLFNN